ncbi:hypothetical protein LCGC14_1079440 [marine sediment metagenome]|uniref:Glycosyl transferase family 1 domain-containing protein n=1 Tax=marine sediment metagenome TaxID=412755 RepID=A0A0F9QLH5_9ZZZZ
MKYAVCLYKYFPFGGLSRDFINIMQCCISSEDTVDIFVMEWQGETPDGYNVHIIPTSGWSNHAKLQSYIDKVIPKLDEGEYDLVIGFNKMPHLDIYYAADPCYLDRVKAEPFYSLLKYSGRVRFYKACERAVFGEQSKTISLMISDVQKALFKQHYNTPEERLISLPPGIDKNRKRPNNADAIRRQVRQEFNLSDDKWLILMVGTGFKTKGVDRAIAAIAHLPESLKADIQLMIIGDGDTSSLTAQAKQLGVEANIHFLGGRSDVPQFLLAADLLIHPARKENTGTVILEAMVAGLPMIVSDVCGYTKHVTKAESGRVFRAADNPSLVAEDIASMLNKTTLSQYSQHALIYADTEDLYSMPQKAAAAITTLAQQKKELG